VYLVGTLSVEEPSRQVSLTAMKEFSEEFKVQYFECELNHVGVNEVFMSLVSKIVSSKEARESPVKNENSSKGESKNEINSLWDYYYYWYNSHQCIKDPWDHPIMS